MTKDEHAVQLRLVRGSLQSDEGKASHHGTYSLHPEFRRCPRCGHPNGLVFCPKCHTPDRAA